jgi:hypothetical protein
MIIRRSLYYAQFALAVVAPAWVLVMRVAAADAIQSSLLVYVILCPIMTVALAAITGVIVARKSVRTTKSVSWIDVAALVSIWVTLFFYGVFAEPLLAVLVIMLIIVGFWAAAYQLFVETKSRVKTLLNPVDEGVYVVPPNRLSR